MVKGTLRSKVDKEKRAKVGKSNLRAQGFQKVLKVSRMSYATYRSKVGKRYIKVQGRKKRYLKVKGWQKVH